MNRYPEDAPTKAEADYEAFLDRSVDAANSREWWNDRDNLHLLASQMLEDSELPENIVHMLEKPWNWTAEFVKAIEVFAAECEEDPEHTLSVRLGGTPHITVITITDVVPGDNEPLSYLVGDDNGILAEFDTEAAASAYISTLEGHEDGRYYIDVTTPLEDYSDEDVRGDR